jgi:hypothetical protein
MIGSTWNSRNAARKTVLAYSATLTWRWEATASRGERAEMLICCPPRSSSSAVLPRRGQRGPGGAENNGRRTQWLSNDGAALHKHGLARALACSVRSIQTAQEQGFAPVAR